MIFYAVEKPHFLIVGAFKPFIVLLLSNLQLSLNIHSDLINCFYVLLKKFLKELNTMIKPLQTNTTSS